MDNIYRNFDECDKRACVIMIGGKHYKGFSINSRIRRESVPEGFYLYEIDGYCKSEDKEKEYTFKIKATSIFNFFGSIVMFDKIPLNDKGFVEINLNSFENEFCNVEL